jgi:hypothetical protein
MPDGRKKERAATRRLSPRAWRPIEVRLEIKGRARKFWVHPDSRVYEECRPDQVRTVARMRNGDRKTQQFGSGMRRVKDPELRARVLQALGQRRDDLRRAQERTRAIVEGNHAT